MFFCGGSQIRVQFFLAHLNYFFHLVAKFFFFQKENKPKRNFATNEKKGKKMGGEPRVIAQRISKESK